MSSDNSDIKNRLKSLNSVKDFSGGKCVVYVMSRDQRVQDNYALLASQRHAIAKKLPLAVVFCLTPGTGYRAREHYQWMLEGLKEVEAELSRLNIAFIMLIGDRGERLNGFIGHTSPDAIYFDFSPLNNSKHYKNELAKQHNIPMYVVDTHNIVPVWVASDKQEFSARTIRPKIHKIVADYLVEPPKPINHPFSWPGKVMSINDLLQKTDNLLSDLNSNGQKDLQKLYKPGAKSAEKQLKNFIIKKLKTYAELRNDPTADGLSDLGPYLHFGHISSQRVILEAFSAKTKDPGLSDGYDVLSEEMVVRKELSDNYCYYNSDYKSLSGATDWAKQTLQKHAKDEREYIYSLEQFEKAQTHDPAWNSAQMQMVKTGKMHGYMRMYWAKKVLEWTHSPEQAIEFLIYLNDFYSIDGGDPNGYVGIMWSVAGVHDRPWGERLVYGTIRSMVYSGLKRKFDIAKYQNQFSNQNLLDL